MPSVRTQEPPDALAAMVLPSYLPSTEVAFDGLGLLFANRSTATILALAKIERVGVKEAAGTSPMGKANIPGDRSRDHRRQGRSGRDEGVRPPTSTCSLAGMP